MAVCKRLVDDRYGRIGLLIGRAEESALAQTRADGGKVVAAHVTNERDLRGKTVRRLAFQLIESRVGEVSERDEVDRSSADDTGNRTHLFELRVYESHASVEVLVSEQRSLEGSIISQSSFQCRCSAGAERSRGAGLHMSAAPTASAVGAPLTALPVRRCSPGSPLGTKLPFKSHNSMSPPQTPAASS